jgi:hypothetical protein
MCDLCYTRSGSPPPPPLPLPLPLSSSTNPLIVRTLLALQPSQVMPPSSRALRPFDGACTGGRHGGLLGAKVPCMGSACLSAAVCRVFVTGKGEWPPIAFLDQAAGSVGCVSPPCLPSDVQAAEARLATVGQPRKKRPRPCYWECGRASLCCLCEPVWFVVEGKGASGKNWGNWAGQPMLSCPTFQERSSSRRKSALGRLGAGMASHVQSPGTRAPQQPQRQPPDAPHSLRLF